jgi:hypothetical protein
VAGIDQRVRLHGVSWKHYEALLAMRGETAIPRLSFLEGEFELSVRALRRAMKQKRR